jgi:hypothetical protein
MITANVVVSKLSQPRPKIRKLQKQKRQAQQTQQSNTKDSRPSSCNIKKANRHCLLLIMTILGHDRSKFGSVGNTQKHNKKGKKHNNQTKEITAPRLRSHVVPSCWAFLLLVLFVPLAVAK